TLPFRPLFRNSHQGKLWGKALGELADQQTHDLDPTPGAEDSLTEADYAHPCKIRDFDFTGNTTFAGVSLKPRPQPDIANSPVAVVVTHKDIIKQHSGIWDERLRNFLVRYVSFLEAKRMLLRQEKLQPGSCEKLEMELRGY